MQSPLLKVLNYSPLVSLFCCLFNFETLLGPYRYVQVATVHGAIAECGNSSYPGNVKFTLLL
jgi:hypothetical protein